jgi:hypothetical protein
VADAQIWIDAIKLAWELLGPLVTRLAETMMKGGDVTKVLLDERLDDIIPEHLRLEVARKAARMQRGLPEAP